MYIYSSTTTDDDGAADEVAKLASLRPNWRLAGLLASDRSQHAIEISGGGTVPQGPRLPHLVGTRLAGNTYIPQLAHQEKLAD